MTRTVTALFDTRADADAAKERLKESNIDTGSINIHDQASTGFTKDAYSTGTHEDTGVWGTVKNAFLPDEDRHYYEEGIRRGGSVLSVDVDDDQVDPTIRVLNDANAVDFDQRAEDWRSQGWEYTAPAAAGAGLFAGRDTDADYARDEVAADRQPLRDDGDEQRIPIVEERLVVGKREVDRGGAKVRSYVTEQPVHEQVRLRNERVDVERRAVDQPLSAADEDPFRERTIEMTARGEEAVVNKEARVVEEVVVRKSADEEVRDIDDTVRRTDVEIEDNLRDRNRDR